MNEFLGPKPEEFRAVRPSDQNIPARDSIGGADRELDRRIDLAWDNRRFVLRRAWDKLNQNRPEGVPPKEEWEIEEAIQEVYEHEIKHYAIASRYDELTVELGLYFFEDQNGDPGFSPYTLVRGTTTLGRCKEIGRGHDELSESDRMQLGNQ